MKNYLELSKKRKQLKLKKKTLEKKLTDISINGCLNNTFQEELKKERTNLLSNIDIINDTIKELDNSLKKYHNYTKIIITVAISTSIAISGLILNEKEKNKK